MAASHFHGGERGNSGGKEGRKVALPVGKEVAEGTGEKKGIRRKGDKVGDMLKASCHTGGNTNKVFLLFQIHIKENKVHYTFRHIRS